MRRYRGLCSACGVVLIPVAVLCFLGLMVFTLVQFQNDLYKRKVFGRIFNLDAGPRQCLQRSSASVKGNDSLGLELSPCGDADIFARDEQRFRLNKEGQLLSLGGMCVSKDLTLVSCGGDNLVWVFTQGSGLVHLETGLCLTREAGVKVSLLTCDDRPEQYWWFQLEDRTA